MRTVFDEARTAFSKLPQDMVLKIEELANEMTKLVSNLDERLAAGEQIVFRLHLVLDAHGVDEYAAAIDEALRKLACGEASLDD